MIADLLKKIHQLNPDAKLARKVFCIGRNKTGTTTMAHTLKALGYKVGKQHEAELLFEDWSKRRFARIISYCLSAEAFQDSPFSLPFTFQAVDQAFPNAKFILTVRNSADEWYDSLVRFHSIKWADGMRTPTEDDLKSAKYIYQGRPFTTNQKIYNPPVGSPYHEETLKGHYRYHNDSIRRYFLNRKDKFIEINVAKDDDYQRLCCFLGRTPVHKKFPKYNATPKNISVK